MYIIFYLFVLHNESQLGPPAIDLQAAHNIQMQANQQGNQPVNQPAKRTPNRMSYTKRVGNGTRRIRRKSVRTRRGKSIRIRRRR